MHNKAITEKKVRRSAICGVNDAFFSCNHLIIPAVTNFPLLSIKYPLM